MDIVSTYRVQFHKGFTFCDAIAIIPYLHDLGITHLYASPYLKAVAGSTHGYDVIDHDHFNPEIGTEQDFRLFVESLTDHGMSHILDTVPNHMGVETNHNHWWNDVLANGTQSKYANYFDFNWDEFAPRQELHGKVLLAVLGETYSEALAAEKLRLKSDSGDLFVYYYDRRFPVHTESDLNTDLNELLNDQHYRLSHWRVSADEINYRRFFDISGLAALQMQRQEVFDDVHRFTLSLIADGSVAGLRVDHPDGLLDPKEYFERLQTAAGKPLFISVEKILNGDETLCEDWPVAGTSGYDFLYAVNDLFIDSVNESAMTDLYTTFAGDPTSYADWVYRNKCQVLDTAMYSEMSALTNRLDALAQAETTSRDFTRRQLHDALREVIACFPVYRSYVSSRGVSDSDLAVVEQTVKRAAERNPKLSSAVLAFICDSVLLRYPVTDAVRFQQLDFARRFQQLTSPVNAKGIEDSTFYIYNRLTSLNEVGGDPGRFGRDPQAIHRYFAHRQKHWPLSISTLSTHDTKRSEDVRARLNVISEITTEWKVHLERWRKLNARLCEGVHPNDQYLLYQTLVGAWPHWPMDEVARASLVKRLCAYMQKATREAKLRTSWVDPNEAYEKSITSLIEKMIDPANKNFLSDFQPFVKRVSYLGMINSISQTVLRLTAPGICDTYQGTELWDLSLVDPDNRRPVDYRMRQKMLQEMKDGCTQDHFLAGLTHRMEDGRIKLWINYQLLRCRRLLPELFLKASYEPIIVTGKYSAHVFGFARHCQQRSIIVIIPRLTASLVGDETWDTIDWGDTQILLPERCFGKPLKSILTDKMVRAARQESLGISELFDGFPASVLMLNH